MTWLTRIERIEKVTDKPGFRVEVFLPEALSGGSAPHMDQFYWLVDDETFKRFVGIQNKQVISYQGRYFVAPDIDGTWIRESTPDEVAEAMRQAAL